jgi:lipoate-protein ligase A
MDSGTLGWEIIAKKNTKGLMCGQRFPGSLDGMYRNLCGGLVTALLKFGIYASYRPPNDIEIQGRKISGTGGTELDDSFIFHGSVLVDFDAETMVNALKIPFKKSKEKQISGFRQRTICMKELLGYVPAMDEVKNCLIQAFAGTLGVEFVRSGLEPEETQILNGELPFFSSDEWIYRRKRNEE